MRLKKFISSSLAIGLLFNFTPASFAGILSEDRRYETFEGGNITIDDILEEDKVDVEIEGNTMVNVANQKDPVSITKAYTVNRTNHIELQGEYDGKARPVIEGDTLVNLYDVSKVKTSNQVRILGNRITATTTDNVYSNFFLDDFSMIKANTLYSVVVDVYKNTLNPNDYIWINSYIDGDISAIRDTSNMRIPGGKTGRFIFTSRSVDDFSLCRRLLRSFIDNKSQTVGAEVDLSIMVLEGDFTSNAPTEYFEGLKSSFEDQLVTQEMVDSGQEKPENLGKYKVEYKVTGKNKINGIWEIGHDVGGIESPDKNIAKSINFIKVQAGTTYTLSKSEDTPSNYRLERINFYKNGRYISHSWNETFKVPSGCNEIKVLICNTEGNNFNNIVLSDIPNFQLEEGSTSTEYESYKESVKTFYLNSPLLEGDTIEDINGKATHVKRYEKIVLDGGENWTIKPEGAVDGHLLFFTNENFVNTNNLENTAISDRFIVETGVYNADYECFVTNEHGRVFIKIHESKLNTPDVSGIKQWLSSNLTTIVYRMSTPIYETISEESILCDSYVDGHLDLNTNIPVNKVDFKLKDIYLKYVNPYTDYTIQFESDNIGRLHYIYLGGTYKFELNISKGINKFNITTSDSVDSGWLGIDGIGFNLSNLVVTEATNGKFDYFEGMKSVGQDDENGHKIKVISSNSDKTQSNRIEIPLREPLRSLSNGVKDKIVKRNGQWFVERNVKEIILNGNEKWDDSTSIANESNLICWYNLPDGKVFTNTKSDRFFTSFIKGGTNIDWSKEAIFSGNAISGQPGRIALSIKKSRLLTNDIQGLKNWLKENPVSIIYELSESIYEPLNIDSTINTYLDITHILNNSTIPANMKVTIDRTINRAIEAIEVAKNNPTVSNISEARYWTNLLKESTKKDELQSEINSITDIEDLQLEKKTATANIDIYVKSENALSLSLSSNSITFENFNGTEDLEQNRAIEMTVSSSLPYEINVYLEKEIQNADKTAIIDKQILNLKESGTTDYKEFADVKTKLTLVSNSDAGNNKIHSFDFKLNGGIAHKADVYKTTIKFEAVQK